MATEEKELLILNVNDSAELNQRIKRIIKKRRLNLSNAIQIEMPVASTGERRIQGQPRREKPKIGHSSARLNLRRRRKVSPTNFDHLSMTVVVEIALPPPPYHPPPSHTHKHIRASLPIR